MSRGRRGLRLPPLSARALAAACVALLVACAGVGLAMRSSLTDYGSCSDELMELPYVVLPAREDKLRTYSSEEIEREAASQQLLEEGDSLEDGARLLGMAPEDVYSVAPLVLTGTFTGRRTYVYQAFQCEVTIDSVIKGEGFSPGDAITVYDAFEIVEPGNLKGGGQFSDVREVQTSGAGTDAFTPMRTGQEYLFFLEPKRYPKTMDPSVYVQTYCLIQHPYARIPLDAVGAPERVRVSSPQELESNEWERIPLSEALDYDVCVRDEASRDLYLENCARILSDTLG